MTDKKKLDEMYVRIKESLCHYIPNPNMLVSHQAADQLWKLIQMIRDRDKKLKIAREALEQALQDADGQEDITELADIFIRLGEALDKIEKDKQ